jgi:hypothetical protein
MKHATSIALHTYWQGCHGRSGVSAGEIRAAELAPILPSLFLIDLNLYAGARFRFCGATLATRYGRDLSNESFLALWNAADREVLERDLRVMGQRAAGLVAGVLAETVAGGFSTYEMMLLPLSGENGTAGAIGSMVRIGGHEETNRIRARIVAQSLRSIRFLPAIGEAFWRRDPELERALSRTAAAKRRQYGHLSVVPGGK